ncbi:MAG: hypothetical protein IPJ88_09330 [Myxococcales bacterium]|nr:MAG: hypothetical protein IPJ88_09330 [Myxococcales bacterium]
MKKRVVVAYHGHCFDGMASAAMLSRFLLDTMDSSLRFEYRPLDHQPGGSFVPSNILDGDINAVVDFRYTISGRLDWWFDHHITGIVGEDERAHFDSHDKSQKFFDPSYGSCCKLIADIGQKVFSWKVSELAELVHWADLIDTASFPSAQAAVELKEPALQLMTVIETYGDAGFLAPRIEKLAQGQSVNTVAMDPEVQRLFKPLKEAVSDNCRVIEKVAVEKNGVVSFDVSNIGTDRYNKFIPYWLFPNARYCVAVSLGNERAKVSVGVNPWSKQKRDVDISAICAEYGGGGHPVVGAVSLEPSEIKKARRIAQEITERLGQQES